MTDVDNDKLPDELVAAMRSADRAPAMITSRVDREIRQRATGQFAARSSRAPKRAWYAAAAAAAAIVLVMQLEPAQQPDNLLYTDVDNSGQIDIVDVLTLAMRDGSSYSQEELDAFALHVVSLGDRS